MKIKDSPSRLNKNKTHHYVRSSYVQNWFENGRPVQYTQKWALDVECLPWNFIRD